MATLYFSYITHELSLKNNLEKGVSFYLKKQERQVIPNKDLKAFKEDILAGIAKLNTSFCRCKPITATWANYSHFKLKDEYLHVGFMTFNLYKSEAKENV